MKWLKRSSDPEKNAEYMKFDPTESFCEGMIILGEGATKEEINASGYEERATSLDSDPVVVIDYANGVWILTDNTGQKFNVQPWGDPRTGYSINDACEFGTSNVWGVRIAETRTIDAFGRVKPWAS